MSRKLPAVIIAFLFITAPAMSETAALSIDSRFVSQSKPSHWKGSKLLGLKVYNYQNENIGEISELLINDRGHVEAAVVSIGGFLGLGKRNIGVPLSELTPPSQVEKKEKIEEIKSKNQAESTTTVGSEESKNSENATGTPPFVILRMTTEDLKSAPEFKYLQ